MTVVVEVLGPEELLPIRGSAQAAGVDLRSATRVLIQPGERMTIPTGMRFAIPPGYEGQIRPRSGLALRCGVTVLNSPGTIDSDYRGEVSVILINHSALSFPVNIGDRIAQLVVAPVERTSFLLVHKLSDTERGEGGFGSTGK